MQASRLAGFGRQLAIAAFTVLLTIPANVVTHDWIQSREAVEASVGWVESESYLRSREAFEQFRVTFETALGSNEDITVSHVLTGESSSGRLETIATFTFRPVGARGPEVSVTASVWAERPVDSIMLSVRNEFDESIGETTLMNLDADFAMAETMAMLSRHYDPGLFTEGGPAR